MRLSCRGVKRRPAESAPVFPDGLRLQYVHADFMYGRRPARRPRRRDLVPDRRRGTGTPLLLLHGGPGAPSHYLNPFSALGAERPVVVFDQLGCGRSDRVCDPALMTIEAHVAQVEALREALGLRNSSCTASPGGGDRRGILLLPSGAGPGFDLQQPAPQRSALAARCGHSDRVPARRNAGSHPPARGNRDIRLPGIPGGHGGLLSAFCHPPDAAAARCRKVFFRNEPGRLQTMWGPSEFTVTGRLRDYDGRPASAISTCRPCSSPARSTKPGRKPFVFSRVSFGGPSSSKSRAPPI